MPIKNMKAASLACSRYMQQASIVGRVRYVTLYMADKANAWERGRDLLKTGPL